MRSALGSSAGNYTVLLRPGQWSIGAVKIPALILVGLRTKPLKWQHAICHSSSETAKPFYYGISVCAFVINIVFVVILLVYY